MLHADCQLAFNQIAVLHLSRGLFRLVTRTLIYIGLIMDIELTPRSLASLRGRKPVYLNVVYDQVTYKLGRAATEDG